MDAALLAAALALKPGERGLEAGCGVGGALLQAAVRYPEARLLGVERDPAALALAVENIALNGLADRVEARGGDVGKGLGTAESFDLAFANPPFFDDPNSLRGPAPERAGAWLADDGLLAWTDFLTKAVREGGRVVVIHRADRLHDLLTALSARAGSFRIRPIQSFADQPAKRILVRAVRGGRAPLALLPALILHDGSGAKHAPQAEAILHGDAGLDWD
jgi:tRNA1(Val) A37 N6-methylase TrmN6